MKKSVFCVVLCLLLAFSGNKTGYAGENPEWKLTGQISGGKTTFTVTATGLSQDISAFELTFLFPAGKTVSGIQPIFQNPDGSKPDCYLDSKEENGQVRVTLYCVNRVGTSFPQGKLLQFEVAAGTKFNKSELTLNGYQLLNQQLKISASVSGGVEYGLEYQSSVTPDGNGGQGGTIITGGTDPQSNVQVTEEEIDEKKVKIVTITDSAKGTVLKFALEGTETTDKTAVEAFYFLSKGSYQQGKDSGIVTITIPEFTLPEEAKQLLKKADLPERLALQVVLPEKELIQQLKSEKNQEVTAVVILPDWTQKSACILSDIRLTKGTLTAAQAEKKSITVAVTEDKKDQILYSWTFTEDALKKAGEIQSDASLLLSVASIKETKPVYEKLSTDKKYQGGGTAVICAENQKLPAQAELKLYLPENSLLTPGHRVYLYQWKEETGKLETLVRSFNYFVDKDGFVTLNVISGETYILLPKAAGNAYITALISQISVPKTFKLSLGDNPDKPVRENLPVELPDHLEKVQTLNQLTKGSAYGGVTISYQSSNKNVVLAGKNGLLTAVGEGTAKIKTTVTLYSGKTKTFTTIVTVAPEKE